MSLLRSCIPVFGGGNDDLVSSLPGDWEFEGDGCVTWVGCGGQVSPRNGNVKTVQVEGAVANANHLVL